MNKFRELYSELLDDRRTIFALPDGVQADFEFSLASAEDGPDDWGPAFEKYGPYLIGKGTLRPVINIFGARKKRNLPRNLLLVDYSVVIISEGADPNITVRIENFSLEGFVWKAFLNLRPQEFHEVERHLIGIDASNGETFSPTKSITIAGTQLLRTQPESEIDFSFRAQASGVFIGNQLFESSFPLTAI